MEERYFVSNSVGILPVANQTDDVFVLAGPLTAALRQ